MILRLKQRYLAGSIEGNDPNFSPAAPLRLSSGGHQSPHQQLRGSIYGPDQNRREPSLAHQVNLRTPE
jgi:hypothetical protein